MTYRGTVKNGVIVLEGSAQLAEGTEVRVEAVERAEEAGQTQDVWDELLRLAGTAEGLPADASRNIDHYLYGQPKR